MKKIIIATKNKGKIKEFQDIFSEYEILTLLDFSQKIELDEDAVTFKENALKKAIQLKDILKIDAIYIADDSGICIDALNGFPGVKTARWSDLPPREKNLKLISMLNGVEKTKRTVHYHTAIAVVDNEHQEVIENVMNGYITTDCRGENGFGFDEIFETEDGRTLAEHTHEELCQIVPRSKALNLLKKYIDEK